MHISVILAHPDNKSFNHAIAHTVVNELHQQGHQVIFHDLYAEKFDPVLPMHEISSEASLSGQIEMHCKEIVGADGIIVIHPNWWGQPPAILKGWIDRIMRPGVAYKFVEGDSGEGTPLGLLQAEKAIVFNTSNTNTEREVCVFGDPLETLWKNCIFGLCGVSNFYRKTFNVVITSGLDQRKQWLIQVQNIIQENFPKCPTA